MSDLIPAATVVPLRDGDDGPEVLMLRRSSRIAFGGMWVFPGGRIDPGDVDPQRPDDDEWTARRAAAREALEEADLVVAPESLVAFSHWTPPDAEVAPRRYATWFFVTRAPGGLDGQVTIDGGEIHEEVWVSPRRMLERLDAGDIQLVPPTFVTLTELASCHDVDAALELAHSRSPFRYVTRFAAVDGGAVTMWEGDAGYASSDPGAPGARHRVWMLDDGWRFERSG